MSIEATENKVKAFDWIIRLLKNYDMSETNLENGVIEAVDELTDEFKQQRESLVGAVEEYKLAVNTILRRPL